MKSKILSKEDIKKKLKQIKEVENGFGAYFQNHFNSVKTLPLYNRLDVNLPNAPGIYIIYNDKKAFYVGRTDDIRIRIQEHTRLGSPVGSATFAFNLAKLDFIEKGLCNDDTSREELIGNEEFMKLFYKKKKILHVCEFKYIELENDILQTMLEPYLAYKLKTYPIYNTFENH